MLFAASQILRGTTQAIFARIPVSSCLNIINKWLPFECQQWNWYVNIDVCTVQRSIHNQQYWSNGCQWNRLYYFHLECKESQGYWAILSVVVRTGEVWKQKKHRYVTAAKGKENKEEEERRVILFEPERLATMKDEKVTGSSRTLSVGVDPAISLKAQLLWRIANSICKHLDKFHILRNDLTCLHECIHVVLNAFAFAADVAERQQMALTQWKLFSRLNRPVYFLYKSAEDGLNLFRRVLNRSLDSYLCAHVTKTTCSYAQTAITRACKQCRGYKAADVLRRSSAFNGCQ